MREPKGLDMIVDKAKSEDIEVPGRPGSRIEVGVHEENGVEQAVIRLRLTNQHGVFSPWASVMVARWSLDLLVERAEREWGYVQPSARKMGKIRRAR